ncbi:hypothetical protein ALP8811_02630 [Aliiroseovarius pelagivivens]|uniref:Sulfotransferase domain-containing protein n=1 Tax=Aliiroseovarius pelagivivens TaxID=1639690 RepID=A0A2R8ARV8_9RHOB|nr:sulfotransferase [Aliiroseovarius pelagivivens]SPF78700.1 hypothetical protein ALP8811_02630 [Aliiroseovarius pelagivivens]
MKAVLKSLGNRLQRSSSVTQIEGPVHIIASPYKTGSTSVGKSLIALGVGHREMQHDGALLKATKPAARRYRKQLAGARDFRAFEAAKKDKVLEQFKPLVAKAARYDIFHDAPMGHTHLHPFIRKIIAPEARFIWVNRDPEGWLESVRKWETSHPEIYRYQGLWKTDPDARIANRLAFWKRHHEAFLALADTFPDHCVELQWSDLKSYSALATFYGVDEPKDAFPHTNAAKS